MCVIKRSTTSKLKNIPTHGADWGRNMTAQKQVEFKNDEDINNAWNNFLDWEEKSNDFIMVKKMYVDLAEDLNAGILLSRIIYWLLPSKRLGTATKLRIAKNGDLWLAKQRTDWWDEIRLSEKQYDRCITILKSKGLVETQIFKFNGDPTTHIKVNKKILLDKLAKLQNNRGEIPFYRKGKNEITQTGKTNSPKEEKHNTKTTTNTTTVESKDSTSNSRKRITSEQDLDIQGNDNSNPLGPQNSTADELRNKAKDVELPTKPEPEPYKCPSTVQPFIDLWKTITGRGYRKDDVYRNDCLAIQKLIHGKFFNKKNTPSIDPEYYDKELSLDDWEFVLQRFALMRNNADYWPKNKAMLSALTINRFLYNGFSKTEKKSYFVICTENEPKLLSSAIKPKPLNDPTPHYTNFLINILKEKLEWDLDNGNRAKAIDAVTKLNTTFERLEPKIANYDYFCGDFYKRAKLLVEMFESLQDRGIPIRPEYINTEKTHSIFIPEYMGRVGLIKS